MRSLLPVGGHESANKRAPAIPDPDIGRRLLGIAGTDTEVVSEMVRRRLEETKGSTEYPQQPWHRIVTICATVLYPGQ